MMEDITADGTPMRSIQQTLTDDHIIGPAKIQGIPNHMRSMGAGQRLLVREYFTEMQRTEE
jgi:hypothetical protein